MPISIKEYVRRLEKYAQGLQDAEPVFLAASNVVRNQTVRVFEEGGVLAGGGRTQYGGGPLYVNPANSVRKFPLKGKNGGGAKFKNGNRRKTAYFANYTAYKKQIGEPSYVNLKVFGNLFRAFGTGVRLDTAGGGKVRVIHSIRVNAANPEGKVRGLIAKYPAAFRPTDAEREEYFEDLRNYQRDLIERVGL